MQAKNFFDIFEFAKIAKYKAFRNIFDKKRIINNNKKYNSFLDLT